MKTFRRPFMRGLSVLLLLCLALPAGASAEAVDTEALGAALADMTLSQNISFTQQEMENILTYSGNLKILPDPDPSIIWLREERELPQGHGHQEVYVNSENVRAASTGYKKNENGYIRFRADHVADHVVDYIFTPKLGITQNEVNAALTDAANNVARALRIEVSYKGSGFYVVSPSREAFNKLTDKEKQALAKTITALAIKDIQLDKGLSYSFVNGIIDNTVSGSGGSTVIEEIPE